MEKHTKSQNSITSSQLLLQMCMHAETPNAVKHKLTLGPKFDTLCEKPRSQVLATDVYVYVHYTVMLKLV
jgi:hypothetical protein